jgi:heme exporter protein C
VTTQQWSTAPPGDPAQVPTSPGGGAGGSGGAPAHTGSRGTRVLGILSVAGLILLAVLALFISPADQTMGDVVRIMYIHVPAAITTYVAFGVTALGSLLYLWRRSTFWDTAAAAAAEIGVVFTGLTLITGSLWGHTTWGTYWEWDPRLTSTALLFVLFLGYLAVRGIPAERHVRARRAAIVGLLAFVDVPIVHYSVDWWRSLHQTATISTLKPTLDGLMLVTLMTGIVVFLVLFLWLMIHRFRVQYLEDQLAEGGLAEAIAERRREAEGAVG